MSVYVCMYILGVCVCVLVRSDTEKQVLRYFYSHYHFHCQVQQKVDNIAFRFCFVRVHTCVCMTEAIERLLELLFHRTDSN